MADSLPVFCAVAMVAQKEEVKRIRWQDSGVAVNVINLSCSPAQGKPPPKQPAAMAVGR